MPAAPAFPVDVAKVSIDVDVNGSVCSFGWWLLIPGLDVALPPQLETLLGDLELGVMGPLTSCLHAGAILTTCRLDSTSARYALSFPPNHGFWTGGQAQGIAVCLHWLTGRRGRAGAALTHLPAVPDVFIAGNARLNDVGYSTLRAAASNLYSTLNALDGIGGGTCVLGLLERRRAGAYIDPPTFSPAIGYEVTQVVTTMRRRLPRSRVHSPTV